MRFQDSVSYAMKNLRNRSLRSWLTIIGIVIGVISMVVITSVTEGITKEVNDIMSSFSPDTMFVVPVNIDSGQLSFGGHTVFGKLYQHDVDSIAGVPGVQETGRVVYGRSTIQFRDKELTTPVYAADSKVFTIFGSMFQLEKGRSYTDAEKQVAVLGYDAANEMFGKDKVDVGNSLLINGKQYRVVGILKDLGNALEAHDNSAVYIPFEDGRDLFKAQLAKDEVSVIYVKLSEGYSADEIKSILERRLASNHRLTLDDKDFSIITADFVRNTVGSILDLLGALLLAITAVATLVGGIGIANTMFMSVLERFREIGILKSIGATDNDILMIFLSESALIGFLGGLIGFAIAVAMLFVAGQFGVPYLIRIRWIIFVFMFSVGVGVLAGFIPARQAARLDPVRALGYF